MYTIKLTMIAKDPANPKAKYARKTQNGIYIPKTKTTSIAKIEKAARDRFDKILKPDNQGLEISYQITVRKLKYDFWIPE